jgi:hypothetical protein
MIKRFDCNNGSELSRGDVASLLIVSHISEGNQERLQVAGRRGTYCRRAELGARRQSPKTLRT